jgi:hypothetical protein
MSVSGDSMTGSLFTMQPVCANRTLNGQYTFARQTTAVQPQPPPAPITLSVTYRQAVPSPDWSRDFGCVHHYGPADLRVYMNGLSTGTVKLSTVAERLFQATVAGAWAGDNWIRFLDVKLCSPGKEPIPTTGVSINGVQLSRVIQLQSPGAAQPVPALAFSLSPDGTVRP